MHGRPIDAARGGRTEHHQEVPLDPGRRRAHLQEGTKRRGKMARQHGAGASGVTGAQVGPLGGPFSWEATSLQSGRGLTSQSLCTSESRVGVTGNPWGAPAGPATKTRATSGAVKGALPSTGTMRQPKCTGRAGLGSSMGHDLTRWSRRLGRKLEWLYFRTCTGVVVLADLQFFGLFFSAHRAAASLLHHTYAYHHWFQFE